MRREYESPMFVGEEYTFCSSIANSECDQNPNTVNEKMVIDLGVRVCSQCGGDKYGETSLAYEYAEKNGLNPKSITVFNDGDTESMGCQFDWNGSVVLQTGKGFTQTFFANSGTDEKHSPAIKDVVFNS